MAIKKAMLNQRLEKKRKERWGSSSSSSSGPVPSSSSARSADGTGGEPDERSAPFDGPRDQEEDEDTATLEREIALLANEMAAIGSGSERVGHVQQQLQHRERMEQEARRISDSFSAEQQRHDLVMKMTQARQRQALQRKLLERKQGSGASAEATLSSGLLLGAALASGALKPVHQPAFRGLEESANAGATATTSSFGGSGLGNRGLSTQHLTRK